MFVSTSIMVTLAPIITLPLESRTTPRTWASKLACPKSGTARDVIRKVSAIIHLEACIEVPPFDAVPQPHQLLSREQYKIAESGVNHKFRSHHCARGSWSCQPRRGKRTGCCEEHPNRVRQIHAQPRGGSVLWAGEDNRGFRSLRVCSNAGQ